MKKHYLFSFLLALAFSVPTAFSQVKYVKHDAAGANDGSSWQNAYTDLQTALANTTAGHIWVAAGTYKPGGAAPDSSSVFAVKTNIEIYGGFAGTESMLTQRDPAANATILSGDINGDDVQDVYATGKADNTQHVVYVDSMLAGPVVIDGFSIKGGHTSNFDTQAGYFWSGGGIHALSRVSVHNCLFFNNFGRMGASVFVGPQGGGSEFYNCSFSHNSSSLRSAGIMLDGLVGANVNKCDFTNNQGIRGVLNMRNSSDIEIDSCHFEANVAATGAGGALYVLNSTTVMVENSGFVGNMAVNSGAVYYDGDTQTITDAGNFVMQNCTFLNNAATAGVGGAIRCLRGSYTLENCLLEGSTSTGTGGHVRNDLAGDNIVYKNVIFKKANCGGWGGAHNLYGEGNFLAENCIYEENTALNLGGAVNNGFRVLATYKNCDFLGNVSTNSAGGALALQNDSTTISVLNCTFTANKAFTRGGAISSGSSTPIVVQDTWFESNQVTNTDGNGGAISMSENDDNISTLTLNKCVFAYNSAPVQGGAVNIGDTDASIVNCLFYGNVAGGIGTGGAISNNASDSNHVEVSILNTTFADNIGVLAAGIANWTGTLEATSNMVLQNCMFRHDGLVNYAIEEGTPNIISNGGNLSDDTSLETYLTEPKDINEGTPEFVDDGNFDYRLANGSVGIDGGVDAGAPATDLDGNPRVGAVDIGSFENQQVSSSGEALLANEGLLRLFPNPATGVAASVTLENAWSGTLQVRLVNILGQTVKVMELEKTAALQTFEVPLDGLRTGIYDLQVSNGTQVLVERFVRM